jgi:hypothetical protein
MPARRILFTRFILWPPSHLICLSGIEVLQVELFRVEFAADPFEILVVLFVARVADRASESDPQGGIYYNPPRC